jgi:hypothetical protein
MWVNVMKKRLNATIKMLHKILIKTNDDVDGHEIIFKWPFAISMANKSAVKLISRPHSHSLADALTFETFSHTQRNSYKVK